MLSTWRSHFTRITLLSALIVACSLAISSCRAEQVAGPPSEATPNVIPVASNPLGAGTLAAATDEEAAASDDQQSAAADEEAAASDEEESNAADTAPIAGARPVISLSAPADGFHFDHTVPPRVPYRGLLGVRGTILVSTTATNNRPQVVFPKAGGMAATVVPDPSCTATPTQCWKFHAVGAQGVPVSAGPAFIGAMGTDVSGISEDTRVTGVVDLCRIGDSDPGETSLDGTQNNRCHFIDGCSLPQWLGETLRNDPMRGRGRNLYNQRSTEFGSGSIPPTEFFAHGHRPARSLPCNNHDVCYQTPNPQGQVFAPRKACDDQMLAEMNAVCERAYPLPAPVPLPLRPAYRAERAKCFQVALEYWSGLRAFGRGRFLDRQREYRLD